MLKLTKVPQAQLGVRPIEWGALPKRFMNPGELEVLVALVRSVKARAVLEIGVNEGRTAAAILTNCETVESYQGIDVPPGYKFGCAVQAKEVPVQPGRYALGDRRFELLLREHGSFDLTSCDLNACDVVFIDGDHSRRAVLNDTELALKVLRRGGLIVWHDYHDLGTVDVRDVLHQLADEGAPLLHVENTWLVYQQV